MSDLVTLARYRAITGDTVSVSAVVEDRLDEATERAEEDLGRPLVSAERTEQCWPDRHRWLWPTATPITVAAGYEIVGHGLRYAADTFSALLTMDPREPDPVSVTYTGGFLERTANPAATNRLPVSIERDIAWVAYALGHLDELMAGAPKGATSVSVGDVSVSWGSNPTSGARDDLVISWSRTTRRYRRRVP